MDIINIQPTDQICDSVQSFFTQNLAVGGGMFVAGFIICFMLFFIPTVILITLNLIWKKKQNQ